MKPIPKYPNLFVCEYGNVWKKDGSEYTKLPTSTSKDGKLVINIKLDNRYHQPLVHRLVWFAHYGYTRNQIRHKNGKITDNRIKNLEIGSNHKSSVKVARNKEVRHEFDNGVSVRALAAKYNVSRQRIRDILRHTP